jgi:hypothetical protein
VTDAEFEKRWMEFTTPLRDKTIKELYELGRECCETQSYVFTPDSSIDFVHNIIAEATHFHTRKKMETQSVSYQQH